MSIYGKLPLALFKITHDNKPLSVTAIKVYVYLTSFKKGRIYPSQKNIALVLGYKEEYIISNAIHELQKANIISILKSHTRRNNMYEILFEKTKNYALIDINLLQSLTLTELKVYSLLLTHERLHTIIDLMYIQKVFTINKSTLYKSLKSLVNKKLIYKTIQQHKCIYTARKVFNKITRLDKNIVYVDFNYKVEKL